MKHARDELWFEVPERRGYLNITPQVEEFVRESGIANGLPRQPDAHHGRRLRERRRERVLLKAIGE